MGWWRRRVIRAPEGGGIRDEMMADVVTATMEGEEGWDDRHVCRFYCEYEPRRGEMPCAVCRAIYSHLALFLPFTLLPTPALPPLAKLSFTVPTLATLFPLLRSCKLTFMRFSINARWASASAVS